MKIVKTLIFLTLFIVGNSYFNQVFSQEINSTEENEEIIFYPYWEKDDHFVYEVTRVKSKSSKNNPPKIDSSVYTVDLTVLDTLNEEYLLKWNIDYQYLSNEIPSEIRAEIKELLDLEIIYKADILGNFIGIENWEVLSGQMKNYMIKLTKLIAEKSGQSDDILESMEKFFSTITSKESLEYFIFKEIPTFHSLYDISLPISEPLVYENEGPTPFSKNLQKFNTKISLLNIDEENGLCILKEETEMEQESMKTIMNDFVKENFNSFSDEKEFDEALKLIKLNISKSKTQSINYNDGIIHNLIYETSTSIDLPENNQVENETIKIRLIPTSQDKH
ncbi:hypothetical protein [Sphingobacterium daejeonense]|uniref:hypothetical protein n=1 Tax=Sphingobacterium daejeonense TaxID=371142 RepID=UPI0010C28EC1|nr:hypothetical protein [Sphingobacterium daejeonense]VTP99799.1 Uncharacterised protein [Sphingobacterium daejeonense]